jgi:hypothetical protein
MDHMRTFLRDHQTGLYYQQENQWTPERSCARDFRGVQEAVKLAVDSSLENVDAVLDFDDPRCDVVVPVLRSCAPA